MSKPVQSYAIGALVMTPKGKGRVISRSDWHSALGGLDREERALEIMNLQAKFGSDWQRTYFVYTVELSEGLKVVIFDSLQVSDA